MATAQSTLTVDKLDKKTVALKEKKRVNANVNARAAYASTRKPSANAQPRQASRT